MHLLPLHALLHPVGVAMARHRRVARGAWLPVEESVHRMRQPHFQHGRARPDKF